MFSRALCGFLAESKVWLLGLIGGLKLLLSVISRELPAVCMVAGMNYPHDPNLYQKMERFMMKLVL